MQCFPDVAFRDGISGRRAHLRGGPDVWEVVSAARDCDADREDFYEHFAPFIARGALDEALAYGERFSNPIEAVIERNRRMERMLAERR